MTVQVVNTESNPMEEPVNCSPPPPLPSPPPPPPHKEEEEEEEEEEEGPVLNASNEEKPNSEKQEEKTENPSPNKVVEKKSFLSDLKESEKKALAELKVKIEEAIAENRFFNKEHTKPKENQQPKEEEKEEAKKPEEEEKTKEEEEEEEKEVGAEEKSEADGNSKAEEIEEISLWGIPLLPSKNSDATDVILLKFLRGREFKVDEAFEMLKNTLQWRKDSKIDSILDETELGKNFGAASYMEGIDREGHPVCYNVPAALQKGEVFKEAFGSKEGREKFLRWRVQVMEKGIQKLDLRPNGVLRILQVTDLKDAVGPSKKELRDTMKQALQVLQDNYPEFVATNIFINVPFWYYAFYALLSPFMTQRTKSKFVITRSANATETLLKYIPAEAIPVHYGGFKREDDTEFSVEHDPVSELVVKASSGETIELAAPEEGTTLIWDVSVLGWDVNYKEEFVPTDEGSYTVLVQKLKKIGSQEEPIRNSFRNNEPGKIVLTVENCTSKKKKVLFRYKTKST